MINTDLFTIKNVAIIAVLGLVALYLFNRFFPKSEAA